MRRARRTFGHVTAWQVGFVKRFLEHGVLRRALVDYIFTLTGLAFGNKAHGLIAQAQLHAAANGLS
jgi:hypothetical protein